MAADDTMTHFTATNLEDDVVHDGSAAKSVGLTPSGISSALARGRLPTIFKAIAAKRLHAARIDGRRSIATLLCALAPRDPLTFIGAAVVLGTVGALAGWLPAPLASRIDPAEVPRESSRMPDRDDHGLVAIGPQ